MSGTTSSQSSLAWLIFALMTVACWGVYGVLLHKGQTLMQPASGPKLDPTLLRYKAFLFVGLAYFLTAVLAPLVLLMARGEAFTGYTAQGSWWSLIAGIAGAAGAFGVLLAFGAKGTPAVVMSIVFAGAPVVNALYSMIQHPPAGGWGGVKWQFYLGIALAAAGGCLVSYFKPAPAPAKPAAVATQPAAPTTAAQH
jgi:drug/metabolite transporter (DMT)-like permease